MERKVFDSPLVVGLTGKENPSEIFCQQQQITEIGDLSDVLSLRKIDLSFNPISSLQNIEQLNQLRHLSAYCCRISDIECLCGIKRLESIMMQQNGISTIPLGVSFLKLRELRLDRNQLTSVEPLSSCSNLRKLDISWNKITSFEGLSGLQNLQELSASHNSITSLKHLRALPSLIELNVSHNQLTDLQGLQLIPTLQVFHAENNQISTLVIPQTFFTHLSKDLDKGEKGKSDKKSISRSSSASSSVSTASKADSRSDARRGRGGSRGGRPTGTGRGGKEKDDKNKESKDEQSETTPTVCAPPVGLPTLFELYLSGNRITTLKGFDAYGTSLDILDLTFNSIQDSMETIIASLSTLTSLTELKVLDGNIQLMQSAEMNPISFHLLPAPIQSKLHPTSSSTSSITSTATLSEVLPKVLPTLKRLDTNPINVTNAHMTSNFHTWEDGSTVISDLKKIEQNEDGKESEEEEDEDEKDEDDPPRAHNPLLIVTTVMSREEIELKETVFRGLLERSKSRLIEAVKAFVPPADPIADNSSQLGGIKSAPQKPEMTKMDQSEEEKDKHAGGKGRPQKKSTEITQSRPKSNQSRPGSGSSHTIPKRRIEATTSEPNLMTPRDGFGNNKISVGFDCRSQRAANQKKVSTTEIARQDSSGDIGKEEKSVDLTLSTQRRGLHSSEEVRKVTRDEDDESIQWKKLNPLDFDDAAVADPAAPVKMNQFVGNEELMPLTTLDTAIDWQQVQHINYQDEDEADEREDGDGDRENRKEGEERDDEDDHLYSPRYTPITQAEFTLPPFSQEKGNVLRSFQVPSLQSLLRESSSDAIND